MQTVPQGPSVLNAQGEPVASAPTPSPATATPNPAPQTVAQPAPQPVAQPVAPATSGMRSLYEEYMAHTPEQAASFRKAARLCKQSSTADAFLANIPNDIAGTFGSDSTPATRIAKGESALLKGTALGYLIYKGITWLI